MIACSLVNKAEIRKHYDIGTPFYRVLWGRHLHHGLWAGKESAHEAAVRLTDSVAEEAGIRTGMRVLDVGCGMGGSAIHLARQYDCRVTGITLSPVQRRWASWSARWNRAERNTSFACADAESVDYPPGSFDVVWSLECTEHLFDKPRFFRRAADWVRPGGRMAICAWLVGDGDLDALASARVSRVCRDFLCPSLGSSQDYVEWMEDAGLVVERVHDWTSQVSRTWELCRRRVRRSGVRWLARRFDRSAERFLNGFTNILEAYESGAMRYGCFIATRPVECRVSSANDAPNAALACRC